MGSGQHPAMVHWYSPRELLRTGTELLTSTVVTRLVDPRALQRAVDFIPSYLDWADRDEVWLDYVADSGEEWNSVYTIARTLVRDRLALTDVALEKYDTHRGDLLVFGGDLVYPTPRDGNYDRRLVAPFKEAAKKLVGEPALFAIPGNHDWYDGLREFTERFCQPDTKFAGWTVKQARSYFVIQLPGDWWLLGIDVQLGERLDPVQIEYFREFRGAITDESRLILCMSEPDWLELRPRYRECQQTPEEQICDALGRDRAIDVCLAGNLHHYRRHVALPEDPMEPRQRITCGGGGSFLHATHQPLHRRLRNHFVMKRSFPSERESKRYRKQVLLFPFWNLSFGLIPAVLYVCLSWTTSLEAKLFDTPLVHARELIWDVFTQLATVVILATFGTISFIALRGRGFLSHALSVGHFVLQLAAVVLVSWGAAQLAADYFDEGTWGLGLTSLALVFVGGWAVGSTLFGFALWSSAFAGSNLDYAYAALRIQDWKSFLRLRVRKDGTLRIYPIGFQRVARRWSRRAEEGDDPLEPEDPRATPPELIEEPIDLGPLPN